MASIVRGRSANKPYSVRYRDDAGNSREKAFAFKWEAQAFVGDLAKGNAVEDSRQTFGDAADRWIATCRPATKRRYEGIMRNQLASLRSRKLREVANARDEIAAMVNGNPAGKAMLSVIRQTCQEAVNAGRLTSHRLAGLKSNHTEGVRDLILHTDEQADVMAGAMGRNGIGVHLGRALGLRPGEVLGLRSDDFMLNGAVKVSRQLHSVTGKLEPLKSKTTMAANRVIPVPEYLARMVRDHARAYGDGPLFTCTRDAYLTSFKSAAVKAGLPAEFTPHQLRHHFATTLLHNGVSLDRVAKLMGHADTRMVSQVYAHWLPGDDDIVRQALSRAA